MSAQCEAWEPQGSRSEPGAGAQNLEQIAESLHEAGLRESFLKQPRVINRL